MASNKKSVVNDNRIEAAFVIRCSFRGITVKLSWLNSERMRILFYSTNKLRKFIRVYKDFLLRDKKLLIRSRVRIAIYVGQTCRQLRLKIVKHKNHILWNTSTRNIITEHRLQKDHDFDWDNVIILDEEPDYRKKLISEMIFIRRQIHGLNSQISTNMEGLFKAYFPS